MNDPSWLHTVWKAPRNRKKNLLALAFLITQNEHLGFEIVSFLKESHEMTTLRRVLLLMSVALVCLSYESQARADILSDLISSGGSITILEPAGYPAYAKIFSNFGYSSASGDAPLASAITVNPIPPSGLDPFGNVGIRFGLAGFDTPDGVSTDFLLTYTVTAVDAAGNPVPVITDVHLASNLSIAGNPGATEFPFGNIVESVAAAGVGQVAQIDNAVTKSSSKLFDWAYFVPPGPYASLTITKDVQLFSTENGIVTLSFIDQSFSEVPEPASVTLLGMGLVGIGLWVRRRKALTP
jgi:PEP-CTERM motif